MKNLVIASLVTLVTTSAFAEVVCWSKDRKHMISISAGDINDQGISPVTEIKVLTDKGAIALKNIKGGFDTYDTGMVGGQLNGTNYFVIIKSMNMHVLKDTNDSALVFGNNKKATTKKLTCMTDGD